MHVHDGRVHTGGRFHHRLYCQVADPGAHGFETPHWRRSENPIESHVDVDRAKGLVNATDTIFRTGLHGYLPNRDTWV